MKAKKAQVDNPFVGTWHIYEMEMWLETSGGNERFAFSWEGQDEMDPASGSGWMQLAGEGEVEGLIKIHRGDRSTFKARKVS